MHILGHLQAFSEHHFLSTAFSLLLLVHCESVRSSESVLIKSHMALLAVYTFVTAAHVAMSFGGQAQKDIRMLILLLSSFNSLDYLFSPYRLATLLLVMLSLLDSSFCFFIAL